MSPFRSLPIQILRFMFLIISTFALLLHSTWRQCSMYVSIFEFIFREDGRMQRENRRKSKNF